MTGSHAAHSPAPGHGPDRRACIPCRALPRLTLAAVLVSTALGWGFVRAADTPALPPSGTTSVLPSTPTPLELSEVLRSVVTQYPPYLAALIERDIADGRLRSAGGVFDLSTFARVFGTPQGKYESTTFEAGLEQFLGLWGATVFGGYRLTGGNSLPDYYSQRTQGDGDARIGLRLPLLQDGSIDPRRAALLRARLDRELADPVIQRQHLDFTRAATAAYFGWLSAGQRLGVAEDILRVARDRQDAIRRQIDRGLAPPIILKENQQLVVSRELGVVRARRRYEATALTLSLFLRSAQDGPVTPDRDRLPAGFPAPEAPGPEPEGEPLTAALRRRPELRQLELARERLDIDLRLARNSRLPRLDASAEASRGFGEDLYKDREPEVKLGLEFRMPLQQSQARGALQEVQARLDQWMRQRAFAQDRIVTEIRNAHQAVSAAAEQVSRAGLNASLARELEQVERDRFQLGAVDLLAIQIREQNAYQARLDELETLEQYFVARADLDAALARDPRGTVGQPTETQPRAVTP